MKKYRNRGVGISGTDALVSGRVGVNGVRTFHCQFEARKVGGSVKGAMDYIAAEGDYAGRDDLEYLHGSSDDVKELRTICSAIEETARVKRGPTAERVLLTCITELPADFDREARAEVARRLVAYWRDRGHISIAAVHHIKGQVQPHVHVAIAARPVFAHDNYHFEVDRDAQPPLRGKQRVRDERKAVAEIINDVAGQELFHHGRLADTGIERKAKRRIPMAVYKIGQRKRDLKKVMQISHKGRLQREAASERKIATKKARMQRARDIAARVGMKALTVIEIDEIGWQYVRHTKARQAARKPKMPAERPRDDLPATAKQISYLLDLARLTASSKGLKTKMAKMDDQEITRGWVGKEIRALETIRRDGVQSRAHQKYNGRK